MTEYKTETLEHLGLVSSMIDELGIVESIDNAIKQDKNERSVEPEEIIDVYKNQFVVERGFRFIKSPEFLGRDYLINYSLV